MKKDRILLIQPRASWGDHVYLPNGIMAVAARFLSVGIECEIIDLNITKQIPIESYLRATMVGVGMLGAPYVPEALEIAKGAVAGGFVRRAILGGPVADKMSAADWEKIVGSPFTDKISVMRENHLDKPDDADKPMPSIFNLSMGTIIDRMSEESQRQYFQKEFCIFTSDGCIFNCSFCVANKGTPEKFRDPDCFRNEVAVIAKLVRKHAGPRPQYEIYLSTLDGLQTAEKMEKMLIIIRDEFSKEGVKVPLRFLATSKYISLSLMNDPAILKRWHDEYGVSCIGVGVDGDDEATWLRLRKTHNKRGQISQALKGIKEAGMVPEAFMVIGFPEESFWATCKALKACITLTFKGIKVRPYLAKDNAPSSDKWDVGPFADNPKLLLHLDYGMFGSKVTHPDTLQRWRANIAYGLGVLFLKLFNQYGCPTQPLIPSEQGSKLWRRFAVWWNQRMPMDR